MADEHLSPDDVSDYWTPEVPPAFADRIDAHVFSCADCADRLDAERTLIASVREAVRFGRFNAIVTDAVLNRLARDGTRVRTYAVESGAVIPCAVWTDDDVVVMRLRADFTGMERVTIVTQVGGQEVDRATDVPVPPTGGELIEAFSAEQLRQVPQTQVRLQVFGSRGAAGDELVAEYFLEHGGAIHR